MEKNELEARTKRFALSIIAFVGGLPKNRITDALGYQLLKSGTSIGANYREARCAESIDEMILSTRSGLQKRKQTRQSIGWN